MRRFILYILTGFFLILSACSERIQLDAKIKQAIKDNPKDIEQILVLQGTLISLVPDNAKLIYDYCQQLNKAGYNSRALKTCRSLLIQAKGNPQYAELYGNILIRNFINPATDTLFQKYCREPAVNQQHTLGLIIDSVQVIDSKLAITPYSANLHAERGKLLFILSETAAADWDIQQCVRYDGDFYNLARNNFHEDNLIDCWNNLIRYQQVVEKRKIPFQKDFSIIKNMVSQLLAIDTLLNRGFEKVPLLQKRAAIYLQAERYQPCIRDLNVIIGLEPSNFNLYAMRAFAHQQSGNDSSAMADLSKAEQLSGRKFPDLDKIIRKKPDN
jgi:tetratricopeptide (TPR) repeat protein